AAMCSVILFLIHETYEMISVMEGDSVTLNTDVTEIQRDDQILWMFKLQNSETRIAEIYKQIISIYDNKENNERFRDKLLMDNQTGSLTIRNIRSEHTGLYELTVISGKTSLKSFSVTVYGNIVTERDSITLESDIKVQSKDMLLWMFGPQETRIAEIYNQNMFMYESNETFGDRLQMDNQTGSLTIRNIRSEHTGLYKLQILSNRGNSYKRFSKPCLERKK
uniref:Immunoglobulin domain-containing protein n=1 Tax=Sinocyclocheilus grahami TaxID=75366 RepID=A0A672KMD3_SINGR